MNYQVHKIIFKYSEGNPILVRGMHTYPNQVVSSHNMRSNLRHGDIEWDAKFLITSPKLNIKVLERLKDIRKLFHKYEKVFRDLHPGMKPYKGVEHAIVLEASAQPIKMKPYQHPNRFTYDIEKAIK